MAAEGGRLLTSHEALWLPMAAGIALVASLTPAAAAAIAADGALASALAATRAAHPYLSVAIDASAKPPTFRRTAAPLPLTVEAVSEAAHLRAAVRRQLDIGVDRAAALARAHVVRAPSETALVLLCDHMIFDARSLVIWLGDIMEALLGSKSSSAGAPSGDAVGVDYSTALVNWTDRIPACASLPPFVPTVQTVMLTPLEPAAAALAAPPSMADVVVIVSRSVLAALVAHAKERGVKLNAPLSTAFAAAVADVARPLPRAPPLHVCALCAVDSRRLLTPPLPARFMNNSAGVVPFSASFPAGADLWGVALAVQSGVAAAIASGEAFRIPDITARGAWAEMGPLFAVPALWSNVGHVAAAGVSAVEVHIAGSSHSAVVSGHVAEADGALALTVTYSPLFHEAATAGAIAERFLAHVAALAAGGPAPYYSEGCVGT